MKVLRLLSVLTLVLGQINDFNIVNYYTRRGYWSPMWTDKMLSDGIWDLECNNHFCEDEDWIKGCSSDFNFYSSCTSIILGNDICEDVCNNAECAWDNGDCSFWNAQWTSAMFENGVCDEECNTYDCYWDNGDCAYCGDPENPCLIEQFQSRICYSQCYHETCDYQNGIWDQTWDKDGLCINLQIGDGVCQLECYIDSCSYDGGDCTCSTDCLWDMIGNGKCDIACQNLECNYDTPDWVCTCDDQKLNDLVCEQEWDTYHCNYDNFICRWEEQCSYEWGDVCMTPACGYANNLDALNHPVEITNLIQAACEPSLVQLAFMSQIKNDSFSTDQIPNWECEPRVLAEKTCQEACNTENCLHHLGRWWMEETSTDKSEDVCEVQHGLAGWDYCLDQKWLLCNLLNNYQYRHRWYVQGCPYGTSAHFKMNKLCEISETSEKTPLKFFVTRPDNFFGIPTAPDFLSLNKAFASANADYVLIEMQSRELMNVHTLDILEKVDRAIDMLAYTYQNNTEPILKHSTAQQILVKPAYWGPPLDENWQYANGDPAVTIEVIEMTHLEFDSELIFENVIIDGSKAHLDDKSQYFEYCSDNSRYPCNDDSIMSQYRQIDLFHLSGPNAKLILRNVVLRNLRAQFRSIIRVGLGSVELENVTFNRILLSASSAPSGVISSTDWLAVENWGAIEFVGGEVNLLNDGYEYGNIQIGQVSSPAGFLTIQRISHVTIEDVTFQFNLVTDGLTSSYTFALIYMQEFLYLQLKNCTFDTNIGSAWGVIYINTGDFEMPITEVVTDDGKDISVNHNRDHILFQNITFTQSMATDKGHMIHIVFGAESLNINMLDSNFTWNVGGPLLSIENLSDENLKQRVMEKSMYTYMHDESIRATIPPGYVKIQNCNFSNNDLHEYLIYLKLLPNLEIGGTTISQNGYEQIFTYEIIQRFIDNRDSYIKESVIITNSLACYGTFQIDGSLITAIRDCTFSYNECIFGYASSAGLYINKPYDGSSDAMIKISNSTFTDNVSLGSRVSALFVDSNGVGFHYVDLKFQRNSCNDINWVYGSVLLYGDKSLHLIENCEFSDNIARTNPALAIVAKWVQIKSTVFYNNISSGTKRGALGFSPVLDIEFMRIEIENCSFGANSAVNGIGGALYIDSSDQGDTYFSLTIISSEFFNNSSNNWASIFIGQIILQEGSKIEDCEFRFNSATEEGGVCFEHIESEIEITRTTFEDLQAKQGSAIVIREPSAKLILTQNTFTRCNNAVKCDSSQLSLDSCIFESNTESCLMISTGIVADSGSVYRGSVIGVNAGISTIYISNNSSYQGSSIQMLDNSTQLSGAAVVTTGYSSYRCISCTYTGNRAEVSGGVVFIDQQSTITIQNSSFEDNYAKKKGACLMLTSCLYSSNTPTLTNSTLQRNTSENSSIFLNECELTISFVSIQHNYITTSSESTPGIEMVFSTLNINSSEFQYQTGYQSSFITCSIHSTLEITNTTFSNGQAEIASAVSVLLSSVTFQNCTFHDFESIAAGAVVGSPNSDITVINSQFYDIKSGRTGGALFVLDCNLRIESTTLQNISQRAIAADSMKLLSISNSNFTNITEPSDGGAVFWSDWDHIQILSSNFHNNTAEYGGSVYAVQWRNQPNDMIFNIDNWKFTNNSANSGGAIYLSNQHLNISNTEFVNNSATLYHGGGVFMSWTGEFQSSYSMNNNTFTSNNAASDGGAVKWDKCKPTQLGNTFLDNSAQYAPEIGSRAVKLKKFDLNRSLASVEFASGQISNKELCFGIYDDYDNLITTENSAIGELQPANFSTTIISGATKVEAQSGVFWFSQFTISAEPGTDISIKVQSNVIEVENESDQNNEEISDEVQIDVYIRQCVSGERLINNECLICPEGTYSIDTSSTSCEECPTGAIWYGNNTMAPESGYWRPHNTTDRFFACPLPSAWLGGELDDGDIQESGRWKEGYTGNKWQSCSDDYSRSGKNQCDAWPDLVENIWIVAIISLVMIVINILMVKSSISSANRAQSMQSVYMRIFINYLQVIMLMLSFNLNWPTFVVSFLSIQETTGSVTGQIYSLDWLLGEQSDILPYYQKLVIISILPIISVILWVLFWTVVSLCKRSTVYMTRELVSTIIVVLFMIHTTVVSTSLSIFSCTEIEPGEYWLSTEQDTRWWEDEHLLYAIRVALPTFLIWGLGMPIVLLILLLKNKKNLKNQDVKMKYGFLYLGYNEKSSYWEFIILYRKLMMAFVSVFLSTISVTVQGLVAFLILIIWLLSQLQRSPYSNQQLNRLETYSIITAGVTIYCGLFYLTESLSKVTNIILFIFILLSNSIFLFYWAKCMVSTLLIRLLAWIKFKNLKIAPFKQDKRSSTTAIDPLEETQNDVTGHHHADDANKNIEHPLEPPLPPINSFEADETYN